MHTTDYRRQLCNLLLQGFSLKDALSQLGIPEWRFANWLRGKRFRSRIIRTLEARLHYVTLISTHHTGDLAPTPPPPPNFAHPTLETSNIADDRELLSRLLHQHEKDRAPAPPPIGATPPNNQ
jgi:hypothetical protein